MQQNKTVLQHVLCQIPGALDRLHAIPRLTTDSSDNWLGAQLLAAQVDVEVWKRRTGLLQLRLSSVQEDVDMYAMRVQMMETLIMHERTARIKSQVCMQSRETAQTMFVPASA